jgi:hypothetical protein
MQCSSCFCDFKRDTPLMLKDKMETFNMNKLIPIILLLAALPCFGQVNTNDIGVIAGTQSVYSIIIGESITVTNSYEFAFGSQRGGIYRTHMTHGEWLVLDALIRRAKMDEQSPNRTDGVK